eukprot:TRINITY_DN27950_c0_g1_i1.p1 TRINITY_DN27950_c0_g1~~TRINITY_DN27950_c0_g1_i1.p1  ORF type:complete len:632 (+),score=76.92 TRINITY_DN27950_c0_g1_i1:57-1952(+)
MAVYEREEAMELGPELSQMGPGGTATQPSASFLSVSADEEELLRPSQVSAAADGGVRRFVSGSSGHRIHVVRPEGTTPRSLSMRQRLRTSRDGHEGARAHTAESWQDSWHTPPSELSQTAPMQSPAPAASHALADVSQRSMPMHAKVSEMSYNNGSVAMIEHQPVAAFPSVPQTQSGAVGTGDSAQPASGWITESETSKGAKTSLVATATSSRPPAAENTHHGGKRVSISLIPNTGAAGEASSSGKADPSTESMRGVPASAGIRRVESMTMYPAYPASLPDDEGSSCPPTSPRSRKSSLRRHSSVQLIPSVTKKPAPTPMPTPLAAPYQSVAKPAASGAAIDTVVEAEGDEGSRCGSHPPPPSDSGASEVSIVMANDSAVLAPPPRTSHTNPTPVPTLPSGAIPSTAHAVDAPPPVSTPIATRPAPPAAAPSPSPAAEGVPVPAGACVESILSPAQQQRVVDRYTSKVVELECLVRMCMARMDSLEARCLIPACAILPAVPPPAEPRDVSPVRLPHDVALPLPGAEQRRLSPCLEDPPQAPVPLPLPPAIPALPAAELLPQPQLLAPLPADAHALAAQPLLPAPLLADVHGAPSARRRLVPNWMLRGGMGSHPPPAAPVRHAFPFSVPRHM